MGFTKMAEDKALKDKNAKQPPAQSYDMSPNDLSGLSMTPDTKDVAAKPALELEKPPAPAGAEPINLSTANLPAGGDIKNKRIGDKLVEQGLISQDQLKVALYE